MLNKSIQDTEDPLGDILDSSQDIRANHITEEIRMETEESTNTAPEDEVDSTDIIDHPELFSETGSMVEIDSDSEAEGVAAPAKEQSKGTKITLEEARAMCPEFRGFANEDIRFKPPGLPIVPVPRDFPRKGGLKVVKKYHTDKKRKEAAKAKAKTGSTPAKRALGSTPGPALSSSSTSAASPAPTGRSGSSDTRGTLSAVNSPGITTPSISTMSLPDMSQPPPDLTRPPPFVPNITRQSIKLPTEITQPLLSKPPTVQDMSVPPPPLLTPLPSRSAPPQSISLPPPSVSVTPIRQKVNPKGAIPKVNKIPSLMSLNILKPVTMKPKPPVTNPMFLTPSTTAPIVNPMYANAANNIITVDDNDDSIPPNNDIDVVTLDDTNNNTEIEITCVIPGIPSSHISTATGRKTLFLMPGADHPPKGSLENMWWCEFCGLSNTTPDTKCKVCKKTSLSGVLCENHFLKRRLIETSGDLESTKRDLKRARLTITNRDEQLFLSETIPVHDIPLVSLDESAEVPVVPNDSNDNHVIVTMSTTNTSINTMATTMTSPSGPMPNRNVTTTTMATTVNTLSTPTFITTRPDSDILAMGMNLVLHGTANQTSEHENPPEPDNAANDQEQMEVEDNRL